MKVGKNGLVFELRKLCCSLLSRLAPQTTGHPTRALPFGIIPMRPSRFSFHHVIQDARCETVFPGNVCPTVQEWGHVCRLEAQNCGGFGAFTNYSSGS
jgi:hypothetical protein